MKRRRTQFGWMSIGTKIFILYFVSMSVAVTAMCYYSYHKTTEIIQSKVGNVALQTVQQAARRLDVVLQEYENRTHLIFSYKELQKGLFGHFRDHYERTVNTAQITEFISNFVNSKNDAINLYILGKHSASYSYTRNDSSVVSVLPPFEPKPEELYWYRSIIEADGRIVWFGIRDSFVKIGGRQTYGEHPVFVMGRALKDIWGSNEIIGVMVYELDPAMIRDILSEIDFNASGSSIIVDAGSRVMGDADGQRMMLWSGLDLPPDPSGMTRLTVDGENMLVVYDQLRVNGWKLVGMAPSKNLVRESREIGLFTLYLASGFMFAAILLALVAARHVRVPVHILLRSMRRAQEGDLETKIAVRRRDEFGVLFESFNVMVSKLKSLIDELYIQKLLKKEMQLKMLASQINAHFIYNTLDSVHWISRIRKVDEISTMVFGLSKYLRISLSSGRDTVTVREAAELVEHYLSIQKVRYQDKFVVDMRVDPELNHCQVLKFVFQPLVENAIYHGLENKRGTGRLDIRWAKNGDHLYFEVIDDGVGIPPGKMKEICESLTHGDVRGEHHFALKNIHSQVQLAYGPQYGLKLESEPGAGTKVTLKLPLLEKAKI